MKTILHTIPVAFVILVVAMGSPVRAEGEWEVTPESQAALEGGLEWLARNQGKGGNWNNTNLGLVSMGLLAYMSDGHVPGRGKYGENAQQALDYILANAKPSGLLNISARGTDMYNHGLTTFVLGQVYGMTGDKRVGRVLDKALRLIQDSQCVDGGWDYVAVSKPKGHDLSLCVMQAKALRSAMDCGLKVEPKVIKRSLAFVRRCYMPNMAFGVSDPNLLRKMACFSYQPGVRARASITMTAIGVVCLQEFGQYDDERITKSMRYLVHMVQKGEKIFNDQYRLSRKVRSYHIAKTHVPFDAYTLYYLSQALYQAGGEDWKTGFTILRNQLVMRQNTSKSVSQKGSWVSTLWGMSGHDAQFYGTAIACFTLGMPNRYLPILQEGRIESLIQSGSAGGAGK